MNDEPGNPDWEQHHADENAALALQQESAGSTHEPVSGPGPYGDKRINAIVDEAVMRERERCAAIVEQACGAEQGPGVDPKDLGQRIAAAIRVGSTGA